MPNCDWKRSRLASGASGRSARQASTCSSVRSTGERLAQVAVPAAGLLDDGAAGLQQGGLARDLELERGVDALEGVHVLDLDLRAERVGALGAERDVHVRAHVAVLEVAVGDAGVDEDLAEALEVFHRLVGGGEVGHADDLHERRAAAVVVDAGVPRVVVDLRGVLLEVDVVEADALRGAGRDAARVDLHAAAEAERGAALGDLVVLRHVRIAVVLPGELGVARDVAAEHEAGHDDELHGLLVRARQRAGQAEADGADVGVGLGLRGEQAPAEHLRAGLQLDVGLEADVDEVFHFFS